MGNDSIKDLQRENGIGIGENKTQNTNHAANMLCKNLFENGNIAVVYGGSMGDEGKGKVATVVESLKDLARVAAPTGGGNAGHTVYFEGKKIALHELPGGATIQHANVYLGQGRVIHIQGLAKEIYALQEIGVNTQKRIYIAGGAHIVFSGLQKALDGAIESIKGKHAVGTTKAGIGPSYALKALRTSITINDLLTNPELCKERVRENLALFGCLGENNEACYTELDEVRNILSQLIEKGDIVIDKQNIKLQQESLAGKKILVECSQSALLAIDGGFYPNVTSSDTSPNGIWSGLNLPLQSHNNVAVVKSIKSKVGNGPFPTKITDEYLAETYRSATGEFGATTGRNRDIGRFDTVETRKVLQSYPSNIIVLTRLDDLHYMGKVKFATGYKNISSGEKHLSHIPLESEYKNIDVEYSREYNLTDAIKGVNHFSDLPAEYKHYVQDIMEVLQFSGDVYLGTGPHASDMMHYKI